MEKIEARKLLTNILLGRLNTACTLVLSDDSIFYKCAEAVLNKTTQNKPKVFTGQTAISDYIQYVRQNDLFEPVQNALIVLDEKITIKKQLTQKIPSAENILFIFGKTNFRNSLNTEFLPNGKQYLSYSPKDSERQKCAEILIGNYLNIQHKTSNNSEQHFQKYLESVSFAELASQALTIYNNNLYFCALHFERMRDGKLNFENAKLPDAPISSFDIINTLLENNLPLLDIRIEQYLQNGAEPASILYALIYFFKQVVAVHVELQHHNNISRALQNAKIPYPAQDNVKKAVQKISYSKIEHFFSVCAQIEIEFRERKKLQQCLLLELSNLL